MVESFSIQLTAAAATTKVVLSVCQGWHKPLNIFDALHCKYFVHYGHEIMHVILILEWHFIF